MTSVDVELALTALAAMCSSTTLTFSVLALVLSERPGRTGFSFFLGAFAATLMVGVGRSIGVTSPLPRPAVPAGFGD